MSAPDFIPPQSPDRTVTDLSGTFSAAQLNDMEKLGSSLSYQAWVLIVPKSYKAQSDEELRTLSQEIARQWGLKDNGLLMVVDLSGKKIRLEAGKTLSQSGVTNHFLKGSVLPSKFYPYVRKGDVQGAVTNSLTAINERMVAAKDLVASKQSRATLNPVNAVHTIGGGNDDAASHAYAISISPLGYATMAGGALILSLAVYLVIRVGKRK